MRFDQKADALYVRLDESPVFQSEEIRPGAMIDLDRRGEVIGFEMLRVSKRLPSAELTHLESDLRRGRPRWVGGLRRNLSPASLPRDSPPTYPLIPGPIRALDHVALGISLRDFSFPPHTAFILPG